MKKIYPGNISATFTHYYCNSLMRTIHVEINVHGFQSRSIITISEETFSYVPYIEIDDNMDLFPLNEIRITIEHIVNDLRSGNLNLQVLNPENKLPKNKWTPKFPHCYPGCIDQTYFHINPYK